MIRRWFKAFAIMRLMSMTGALVVFSLALALADELYTGTVPETEFHRIAYIEGGPYWEYRDSLEALLQSLFQLKLLSAAPPGNLESSWDLWQWAAALDNPRLHFSAEHYYSSRWNNQNRLQTQALVYDAIDAGEVDMVLAMGTWAGLDLSQKDPGVPVLVMAVSDAITAGLFREGVPGDPPWLHVRIDPARYDRQVRIFYETMGFERLGVVFKDTAAGRSYAALDTVLAVGAELGIEVLSCAIPDGLDDPAEEKVLLDCYDRLIRQADALYVTAQKSLNERTLPLLVQRSLEHEIPTFSQNGSAEVREGLLMSIAQFSFSYVGDFTARVFSRILAGESPGALPMIFEDPAKIAINLVTAMTIGYDVPVDILVAADEIFQSIPQMTP